MCLRNFVKRPIRHARAIVKYPASTERVFDPKDLTKANKQTEKFKNILPEKR